jgi:hypothetical protein
MPSFLVLGQGNRHDPGACSLEESRSPKAGDLWACVGHIAKPSSNREKVHLPQRKWGRGEGEGRRVNYPICHISNPKLSLLHGAGGQ